MTVSTGLNLRNKVDENIYSSIRNEKDNSENVSVKKMYNFYIKKWSMAYLRYKTLKEKQNSKCATMDSNQLFMMV